MRETKPFQNLAKAATGGPPSGFAEAMLHLTGALADAALAHSMSRPR